MGHFMRDDRSDSLFQVHRTLFLVDLQKHFAKGDAAGVLHCARGKIGQADQIEFAVGILDAEIFVVIAQNVFRGFQSKLPHFFFAGGAVDADGNAIGFALDVFEVAHDQGGQI